MTSQNQSSCSTQTTVDRLKNLYPNVNESIEPLPRTWSSSEKCSSIELSQNKLRVLYKGIYCFYLLALYRIKKYFSKLNNHNIILLYVLIIHLLYEI